MPCEFPHMNPDHVDLTEGNNRITATRSWESTEKGDRMWLPMDTSNRKNGGASSGLLLHNRLDVIVTMHYVLPNN